MSDAGHTDGALQFERAEFVAPEQRACAVCQDPIAEQYYTIAGRTTCTGCHAAVQNSLAQQGTPASRFFAALGWGGGAALLGAAIYYGIRAATGYELGFIAIVVGVLVGKGVARGSRLRGGVGYQLLAVSLTYLAIALTYLPEV